MSKTRFDTCLNELCAQTPPPPKYDQNKVDDAVLALLYLTLHQPGPYLAWKGVRLGRARPATSERADR